jgi:uncharacterized protein YbjT (DUF2867 family)
MTHKAFVAGATGYTGQAVVAELCKQGIKTIAHIRPDSPRLEQWTKRFEAMGAELECCPWELDSMTERLGKHAPTLVFSLLGTTKARMRKVARAGGDADKQSYQAVDYGLSRLLLGATHSEAPEARFIYLSSAGVQKNSRMEYLAVRWQLEQEIQSLGIDYIIARPSFITGPNREEDRLGERIGAKAVNGILGFAAILGAKKLKDKYRSVTNEELAQGLIHHALAKDSSKRTLESNEIR